MPWSVIFHDIFAEEFNNFSTGVKNELLAHSKLLEHFGPGLGRPSVDTLKNSRHSNMKELRFNHVNEVWRVVFAFDPKRRAIVLAAGDKCGVDQKRFYEKLIAKADRRFDQHLEVVRLELGKKRKER